MFVQIVDRSSELDAPAAAVWPAALTPAAFREVTRGLVRLPVIADREAPWSEDETVTGWLFLFGAIPLSRHTLHVARIDHERMLLRTDEHGGLLRQWSHEILVTPIDGERCRYRDRIEIDAGVLTPVVAWWAGWFYGVRQRRWRSLATRLVERT